MPFVLITDQWEWVRDAETWENISANSKQKTNGLQVYAVMIQHNGNQENEN